MIATPSQVIVLRISLLLRLRAYILLAETYYGDNKDRLYLRQWGELQVLGWAGVQYLLKNEIR